MRLYKGNGTPKAWTMDNSVVGSTLTMIAKYRDTEKREGGWYVGEFTERDRWEADMTRLPGYQELKGMFKRIADYGICKLLEDRTSSLPVGPAKIHGIEGKPGYIDHFEMKVEGIWEKDREAPYKLDPILVKAILATTEFPDDMSETDQVATIEKTLKDNRVDPKAFLADRQKTREAYDSLLAAAKSATKVSVLDLGS